MFLIRKLIVDCFEKYKKPPKTQLELYKIGKMLGKGAFGKVNLGLHRLTRKLVAIKSINMDFMKEESQKKKIMNEINILKSLRHPNNIKILETFQTDKHHMIVMELCPGGDLLNYVRKRRKLSEKYARFVFKQIMEGIINNMVTNTNTDLNLWKSTKEVLKWFIGMSKETKTKFVKFDIVEFYPSITEDLLDKAIQFALQTNVLSPREIEIIKHTKNALLFHKGEAWEKKDRTFDVTMGSYDGAETCELVGLYMLDKLKQDVPAHQIGLYRDDGLAIIPQSNGPKLDKIRKQITATFKKEGLKITIETNMVEVDFLDVTLNLNTGKYSPFRKPNDTPLYVNKHSNHPPTIIKQLPEMIKRRISDISCNKEEFDKAKGTYETALKNSGYDQQLEYIDVNPNLKPVKKKRARKIIWFNPPYSSNVTTNIGQKFFRLLDKHFPKGHRLHKLFNRNTVKLSYSCLPNIGAVLKSTRQQASKEPAAAVKMCNCRNPTTCPLEGQCLKSAVIYEATLDTAAAQFKYIGLTENTFKSRYSSHTSSFRHEKLRHSTELSKKVWEMKDCDTPYDISWKIIQHAHPYKGGTRECNLCLTEKLYILMSDCKNLLNKRRELVSKCRHTNKFMLKTVH